ncbi:NAD(P)-dependent oxidoreductase [Seleniivibrio woodruffii]|uniref:NAD-dependent epimerase/dehydratase family protein n=1 Tax=Seleniivibrio woodruffii TaxID=1078050 RepID=UPI0026EF25B1|nr:SDR family oxidoreductase [Seleniivibrio woodruffii]
MGETLVVGGSGYIGRHMRKVLPEFIYLSSGDMNILSRISVAEYLNGRDVSLCIILAAVKSYDRTADITKEPFLTNVAGLDILLSELKKRDVRIIYFSSMTVYSPENSGATDENGLIAPMHGYGLSKLYAEHMLCFHNLPTAVLRIPGVYGGERMDGYIHNAVRKIAKGETFEPDFTDMGYWCTIHIDDLLHMLIAFIHSYTFEKRFEIFNLSYGEDTDPLATAVFIKKFLKSESEIRHIGSYSKFYLTSSRLDSGCRPLMRYYDRLSKYIREIV